MSKIGANIRKIRLTKGFSQAKFAELFGLTRASIGAYEEGRAEPKIDTVIEIAKYFSISLDVIFTKNITVNQLTNFDLSIAKNTDNHKNKVKKGFALSFIDFNVLEDHKSVLARLENIKASETIDFPKIIDHADTYFNFKTGSILGINNQKLKGIVCARVQKPSKNTSIIVVNGHEIVVGNYISGTSKVSIKPLNSTEIIVFENAQFFFEIKLFLTSSLDMFNYLDAKFLQLEARLGEVKK